MSGVVNRYAGIGLFMAERTHDSISQFVGPTKPFTRYIDAWWLGLCVGVKFNKGQPEVGKRIKFMDGNILGSDPWRITHLELLALAEEGAEVVKQPGRVVAIATNYANYGLNWLVEECLLENLEPKVVLLTKLNPEALAA
jgi:hypothetical protein